MESSIYGTYAICRARPLCPFQSWPSYKKPLGLPASSCLLPPASSRVWPQGSRHLPILAWLSMFLAWTTAYLTVSRISEVIHQLHPMGWNCPRCSILIYSSTKQQHAGQEWRKAQALLAWLPMNKFTRPQETRKTIRESKGFKMISGSFANMYKTTVVFLKESPLLSILSKSSLFFRSNKVNYSSPWASW